jgi:hypothetical protein
VQHYSMADEIDRDTFMRYGPFHPVRVAIARQLEEAAREHDTTLEESVDNAFKDGQRHRNDLAEELKAKVERLERQLAAAPKPADMWAMRYALDWIAEGNMTKADMIAKAKKALAEIAQRKLEATKAA